MTTIKKVYTKVFEHKRNEIKLQREINLASKNRKKKTREWAYYSDRLIDERVCKDEGVSLRACHAVVMAINKCSFTGDFTNAKQKRIAEVAKYSKRTVVNAFKALKKMNLLYTKHRYEGEGQNKRRVASYTILAAFRRRFNTVKSWLNEGLVASEIEQKLLGFSVSAATASQLKAFNKVDSKFGVVNYETGDILPVSEGALDVKNEFILSVGGV